MGNKNISIKIDGKSIQVNEGANLLKAARDNGFDIPGLCYHHRISPTGACRLCTVKLKTDRGVTLVTACSVAAAEGMDVIAFDEELENFRKEILDLLLSEHNEKSDGSYEDEFLVLIKRYGLDKKSARRFPSVWKKMGYPVDDSSPVLDYDGTKCIKCFRCIKACDEIQGKNVLSFAQKGIKSYIVAGFGKWNESECDGCGECVQLCPTGAIVEKSLTGKVNINKISRRVRTTCAYCGVGCQMELWVQNNKIVRVTGYEAMPNQGRLCVKGRFGYEYVHSADRLRRPLIRRRGRLVECSMKEALDTIANRFMEIKGTFGPQAFGGYSSAKCTNEENYLFQKFFRAVLGTNNVEHCTRLCHASTVTAMQKAIGSGAMGNSVREFENCDCILVIGSNPVETHPVSATFIKRGARNGAKIIVIDPHRTPLVKYAFKWLKQKPGTDVALLNAFVNVIIKEGLINEDFIKSRVEGGMEAFAKLKETVSKYPLEKVSRITGIKASDIAEAALVYARAKRASIVTGMGMSQSTHGTNNVLALINLALITGNFGRESTGINPLRGQNNVQGASDMGAIYNVFTGYQKVIDAEVRKKFAAVWNVPFDKLSGEPGLSSVEMIHAAHKGVVKAMYIMGENPMLTDPNLNHAYAGLKKLDFLVVQDIFLTETAKLADVVLPGTCFAEKDGTFANTDRRVLRVRKAVEPPGECLEDRMYIAEISRRMGYPMEYENAGEIMKEIASLTPSYGGISYERLERGEELQWPCPHAEHPGTPFLYAESFPSGKGTLHYVEHDALKEGPDGTYPFILNTGRTLYQYHTATMTRRSAPLMAFDPEPILEMNPADTKRLKLKERDLVKIISRRGEIKTRVKATEKVGKGELFLSFHFAEAPVNKLTSDELDPFSRIPGYKQTAVKVVKI